MGALAPYLRLERVQQKTLVRYYSVRAGRVIAASGMTAMESKALRPKLAGSRSSHVFARYPRGLSYRDTELHPKLYSYVMPVKPALKRTAA